MERHEHPAVTIIEEVSERMVQLQDILKNQPLRTISISNCQLALQSIASDIPSLIIMDLSSQRSCKEALCDELCSNPLYASVKFLFIVPEGDSQTKKVPEHQLGGYITKPFYFGDVLGKLHASLYDSLVGQLAS